MTEGTNRAGSGILVTDNYTGISVTDGQIEEVNASPQYEVKQYEAPFKKTLCVAPIKHSIISALSGQQKQIRVDLTSDIAGIEKIFTVQNFTLDWTTVSETKPSPRHVTPALCSSCRALVPLPLPQVLVVRH